MRPAARAQDGKVCQISLLHGLLLLRVHAELLEGWSGNGVRHVWRLGSKHGASGQDPKITVSGVLWQENRETEMSYSQYSGF